MKNKYICQNCGKQFEYCRACIFKPIYYHEAGFCSEQCCAEYRNKSKTETLEQEVPVANVKPKGVRKPKKEIPVIEEIVGMEYTSSFGTEWCVSDKDIETALDE